MNQLKHTPTPWKIWHSGFANAPYIIYTGDVAPVLRQSVLEGGKWLPEYPNGCFYIGEISSQRMHLDENENVTIHENAAFIVKVVNCYDELIKQLKDAVFQLHKAALDIKLLGRQDLSLEFSKKTREYYATLAKAGVA